LPSWRGIRSASPHQDENGGRGQGIDLALYEEMFRIMNQVEEYGRCRKIPIRRGNPNPQAEKICRFAKAGEYKFRGMPRSARQKNSL
jgi:hypothetical protein